MAGKKRPLDKYTRMTLIPGEKIAYAAKLHPFSRYWGLFLLAVGALLLSPELTANVTENKTGPAAVSAGDGKEKNFAERNIDGAKEKAKGYVAEARRAADNFMDKMPPSVRRIFDNAMRARRKMAGTALFFFGIYIFTMSLIRKFTVEHTITTYKVLRKTGLISVNANEVPLKQIEGARVKQTMLDRLINRGNVLITGVGMERIEARKISDPELFRKKINEAVYRFGKE